MKARESLKTPAGNLIFGVAAVIGMIHSVRAAINPWTESLWEKLLTGIGLGPF